MNKISKRIQAKKFHDDTILEELREIAATDYTEEELANIFDIPLKRINLRFDANKKNMSKKRANFIRNISIKEKIFDKAIDGDVPTLIYLAITRLGMTNL
ncbi:MAG: hypothetical protein R8G33_03500 [Gammaproteobacteria bacterium]|nr:hypothetical protein [Gammaproteobacteria bacterium]